MDSNQDLKWSWKLDDSGVIIRSLHFFRIMYLPFHRNVYILPFVWCHTAVVICRLTPETPECNWIIFQLDITRSPHPYEIGIAVIGIHHSLLVGILYGKAFTQIELVISSYVLSPDSADIPAPAITKRNDAFLINDATRFSSSSCASILIELFSFNP